MASGSFLAGNIPLAFNFNSNSLKLISTFGAGLLVGTALNVIIPEGVQTLYSSSHDDHHHTTTTSPSTHPDNHSTFSSPESLIGTSLTLGFLFMFLIDTLGDFLMHTHNHHHPQQIQLSEFRESTNSLLGNENVEKKKKSGYATLGLVVHAAADGIAMGAASASDRSSLEFLVFMAIMLHKAPSAFGLSTFLLQQNRSRRNIRYYLLIFSLAAPIAAILTFLSLKQTLYTLFFPDDTQEPSSSTKKLDEEKQESIQVWTGVLLLFSAGTFLYVSTMHILPEIYVESGNGLSNSNEKKLSMGQILMLCLGMITPFFLSVGHHH